MSASKGPRGRGATSRITIRSAGPKRAAKWANSKEMKPPPMKTRRGGSWSSSRKSLLVIRCSAPGKDSGMGWAPVARTKYFAFSGSPFTTRVSGSAKAAVPAMKSMPEPSSPLRVPSGMGAVKARLASRMADQSISGGVTSPLPAKCRARAMVSVAS